MRRICFINYKGGTGKTSCVVNVGHGLARKDKRVLIIDTDPQGSAGYYLGVTPKKALYDVLINNAPLTECIQTVRDNLDILCAGDRLFPAEIKLSRLENRESVLRSRLSKLEGYDFVMVDCGPSMNLLNQNALLFSDEIYVPVSMEYLSLIAVKQLLSNLSLINKMFQHCFKHVKVIPTFYDARLTKSKDVIRSLLRVFPGQVTKPIRSNMALSKAPGYNQSIFEYDMNSIGAIDYEILTKEVLLDGK